MNTRSRILLAATLASALAVPMAVADGGSAPKDQQKPVPCYGINKCKGTSDCKAQGHSCKGQNSCKGQGFLEIDKDLCLKIEGGRLTPQK